MVTGSIPHACGTSQRINAHRLCTGSLAGREKGPRLMSVATHRNLLPPHGPTHHGTVLGPPQHW